MCGIFGIVSEGTAKPSDFKRLARFAQQRGKDSSGVIQFQKNGYKIARADDSIMNLLSQLDLSHSAIVLGHSRLVTNGHSDNQPIVKDGVYVLHNGIIVNEEQLWSQIPLTKELLVDSELIAAYAIDHMNNNRSIDELPQVILDEFVGTVSCVIVLPEKGKLLLLSNNGSLYVGNKHGDQYFSSEQFPLDKLGCRDVEQVINAHRVIDIPISSEAPVERNLESTRLNLVPPLGISRANEKLLQFDPVSLKRCAKCILPETMPFIRFDSNGICNYCLNYKPRNVPKDKELLFELVEKYRRKSGNECIVPFSGGRDSCYSLHLVVNELKLKPLAYTYDWGMVTDLGRRNISRMCAQLGVENIVIAADIGQKRRNIAKNVRAWLRSPHLGMISIFTAGDKHFFRYVETVKKQTGISLHLWGINPLEVTHFKAGFLGIPPDFEEDKVYSNGAIRQLHYQFQRLRAMAKSPAYFNSSLWDTLSGEWYRSYHKKTDYYHVFDYWRWEEDVVDRTLLDLYDWEIAPDTTSTWRIGDGTAAFYNYIYYTVAGFTEHDTFRSNQIREGQLERGEALEMVKRENRPRYPNIQWYLDSIGMDFKEVITRINMIPKLYDNQTLGKDSTCSEHDLRQGVTTNS